MATMFHTWHDLLLGCSFVPPALYPFLHIFVVTHRNHPYDHCLTCLLAVPPLLAQLT
jgi:hypothetical protein